MSEALKDIAARLADRADWTGHIASITVDPAAVEKTYSGDAFKCMCGCAGKYRYEEDEARLSLRRWRLGIKGKVSRMNKVLAMPAMNSECEEPEGHVVWISGDMANTTSGMTIAVDKVAVQISHRYWQRPTRKGRRNTVTIKAGSEVTLEAVGDGKYNLIVKAKEVK